jgi:excinuclease ABC subunit A
LVIQGARQNNLKNITVRIPHDALTVITGVSGSGKSSLAFDTLFAEGQWRYVESLSTYTRMFVERLDRPEVDQLINVRPAIAIEQKNTVRTARSTVGTATELADYLRVLFARLGHLVCPTCHKEARADTPQSIVDQLFSHYSQARAMVLFPVPVPQKGKERLFVDSWLRRGFIRLFCGTELIDLSSWSKRASPFTTPLYVVLDRLIVREDDRARWTEALETAFREGEGCCRVDVVDHGQFEFHETLQCPTCHFRFDSLRPILFSFNHPLGACPECKGFGNVLQYDEALVIPDRLRSLSDGAIDPWAKPGTVKWQRQFLRALQRRGIDPHVSYSDLGEEDRAWVWTGEKGFKGISQFFQTLERKRYKLHVRVFLSRYRSAVSCQACGGTRLRPAAQSVLIQGKTFPDVLQMTIGEFQRWMTNLSLSGMEMEVAQDLLGRLKAKVGVLCRVGLDYLSLNRESRTLSGGESQRISLANQLGTHLVGTLYVLDEPTIGLHAKDTETLLSVVKDLAGRGNTVVVVEHDRQVMGQADYLIEMGPGSGAKGGHIVSEGIPSVFLKNQKSLTAQYLRGDVSIPIPLHRREGHGTQLVLEGVRAHNLQHLTVQIPLGMLVCLTGVSGSGKSTLLTHTLFPAVASHLKDGMLFPPHLTRVIGWEQLDSVSLIDQEPIGRTPRSNPITYVKAYESIRKLFASIPGARRVGLTPSHFSFNAGPGRCPRCQGNGYEKVEMYFFEDLYVTCEECQGRRFRKDVLGCQYQNVSIDHVLSMTVDEAQEFFPMEALPGLAKPFTILHELGLGYLQLGQSATTLSGGEAQRLKIASELLKLERTRRLSSRKKSPKNTSKKWKPQDRTNPLSSSRDGVALQSGGGLYLFDEPTTGLHMDDVNKLLLVFNRLVEAGNTVVIVEHNLDVIQSADWVIDLGPEGGDRGGQIIAEGRPEDIVQVPHSYTGQALKSYLV